MVPFGGMASRASRLALLAVALLAAVVVIVTTRGTTHQAPSGNGPTAGPLQVGDPAPVVALASTAGGTIDLAAFRGKRNVILYFYEHAG